MNPERPSQSSNYWTLAPYVRREWRTIAQALLGTIIFVSFWPILAWLSGNILEQLAAGNVPVVSRFIAITMAGFALQKIGQYIQDSLMAKAALEVAFNLRRDVYTHIHRLSLTYFERSQTGDLSYRLTEDIDRIGEVVQKLFHDFLPSVLQLVVVLGYMVYLNWQLTLTAVVLVPILAILAGWFGEQMLKFSRRSQNLVSDLSSLVTEVFSGIRLVRAFAAEEYEVERFTQEAEKNRQAKYKAAWLQAVQYPVVGFTYAVVVMLILLVGTWQISQENLTGASFGSYVVAALMLIDPVNHVIINYGEFKQGEASVDRVIELLDIEPAVRELPTATDLPQVTGRVEYRNVTFGYEADEPVLRNLDLLALPGEKIALVGSSGAGKSTLVNLLPRFYDPQSGQIFIDNVDVATVTLRSLRRQIGIVPQETTLFSGTIAQNIAFGQKDFDIEAVEAAARIANAHDFISQFSQGYYTWMGERGVNLSGGQRQRVAIARAVLLNPRILILDEATSALDAESEALVQEALERLMSDRTVFIIAHRLATVRDADRILVMEKGQVIEAGTHSELLANQSRYAQFYAQQFAGSSQG
ncbi:MULTISPECIES: ABC transporter ATP-binding protein [Cyanophyceae]|uniref:ABC transporter ATP-binding protein n=1 Tax=Cyanophyceae TaxID=3028117 RepID=UPI001686A0FC|nr:MULTISPECIES: ABC transporter ATP-binding protein [Cyanophyceae]MBD1915782.1 ABC transporter ATP-binding protein [Phormidium sp. FACHB-77]MBD2030544.1 ABC transporter ATP-binding protein [Phormidium sp. FACHB-322]MBD2053546.1 ABC transporter ATP-binding protein [Leptolyngbya sp. FACHB-60]